VNKTLRSVFYQANVTWVRGLLLWCAKRDIQGTENVPRKGPLIITCNHLNNADSPILTEAIPREVAWLTKAEWFSTPGIGWMFKAGGMIPVRREAADLHALREAQEALKQGRALGMFPEGHRSRTGGLQKGEPGSALIALRSGAPVLPIAIWGTEDVKLPRDMFIPQTKAHVRFGKPYELPRVKRIGREEVAQGTETIMKAIAALLPEKYWGVYADKMKSDGETKVSAG
jgi:1-acyl-sn-glycerol-3-phosphate acyltransferase